MAQKFIITTNGNFRLGDVKMHKDLLEPLDDCLGGGSYEIDYTRNCLILSGASYDYGSPKWERLLRNNTMIKIPKAYQGMSIVYKYDDPERSSIQLTQDFQINYI